jgi:hypothetical protein
MGQSKGVVHELAHTYVVPSAVTQLFEAQSLFDAHDAPLPPIPEPPVVPPLEDVVVPPPVVVVPLEWLVPLVPLVPVVVEPDVEPEVPGPPAQVGAG